MIKTAQTEQCPNYLFDLFPYHNKSLSSFSLSTLLPICYSPLFSPSFSLHQASSFRAKLHLINNGCCCLLHCWRRAGTLGNAGATFNWMGLLMHPAGETPSQRLPFFPLYCNTHILMHTLHPSIRPPHLLPHSHAMQLFSQREELEE